MAAQRAAGGKSAFSSPQGTVGASITSVGAISTLMPARLRPTQVGPPALPGSASPDEQKADGDIAVNAPTRLRRDPSVVDGLLVHLGQYPPCRQRRVNMFGRQMDVGLDSDRFATWTIEVGGHSGLHDEEGVEPDEDVDRTRPSQARGLTIERPKVAEMLIQ
jgi:hypothetical protein